MEAYFLFQNLSEKCYLFCDPSGTDLKKNSFLKGCQKPPTTSQYNKIEFYVIMVT